MTTKSSGKDGATVTSISALETLKLLRLFIRQLFYIYGEQSFSENSFMQLAHSQGLKIANNAYEFYELLTAIETLQVPRYYLEMTPGLDADERYHRWFQFQSIVKPKNPLNNTQEPEEFETDYSPCTPSVTSKY